MTWSCLLTSFLLGVAGKKGTAQQTEGWRDRRTDEWMQPLPKVQPQAHPGSWQLCDPVPVNF